MKPLALAAAIALSLASAPSHATSSATATLGPLLVTLYDLALNDGIAPSISFASTDQSVYNATAGAGLWATNFAGNPYPESGQGGSASSPWGAVSATASTSYGSATAAVNAATADNGQGASFMVSGAVSAPTSSSPDDYASFSAYAMGYSEKVGFTLSANTRVTFAALASVSLAVSSNNASDAAQAVAAVSTSATDPSGEFTQYSEDPVFANIGPGSYSENRTLSVSLSNDSSTDLSGSFGIFAYGYGKAYAPAAPVPEPQTCALLLSGLGLIAAVARRRPRQLPSA